MARFSPRVGHDVAPTRNSRPGNPGNPEALQHRSYASELHQECRGKPTKRTRFGRDRDGQRRILQRSCNGSERASELRSAKLSHCNTMDLGLEARGGIEPPIKVLQTFALPLGDRASVQGAGADRLRANLPIDQRWLATLRSQ